ncbi:MAG: glycosyltransferase family 2 protein [Gammaproteobacteria bacterium]
MTSPPRVSVAVPIFNEEEIVRELIRRLDRVLTDLPGGPHEMVIVDDGSADGTVDILESEAASDPRIVVVALSRNFGHQAAITAALDHVTGDVVVVMDGDLQDAPEVIPRFLDKYQQGYDVVYALRKTRQEPLWLRACYKTFYRILARLSNIELPVDAGDFGLMSKRVVSELRRTSERHRYLRGLRAWAGFRQIGIPVDRSARAAGRSKYSATRLLRLALDGLFAFTVVPLRMATVLGLIAILLSSLFALYSLYVRLVEDRSPEGFTALIIVITFLSGINLLFMGVLGEYLGRVYEEVKGRPLYVVQRIIRRDQYGLDLSPICW